MTNNFARFLHRITPAGLVAVSLFAGFSLPATVPSAYAQKSPVKNEKQVTPKATEKLWLDSKRRAPTKKDGDTVLRHASFSRLATTLGPAVVNVLVSYPSFQEQDPAQNAPIDWSDPRNQGGAQGSGFIIHPSGYILTNFHVVDGAQRINVRLADNSELPADVIGVDAETDIALIKIDSPDALPSVVLGDSDLIEVGEYVVAIGNPLGLDHTVTAGIISALGRKNLTIEGRELYSNFIQTDASINPGNSGGPLISLHGEVIGINTAINKQAQGISFAIPINMVKTLLPQLQTQGYVTRSWLGVRVQELHPTLAISFGLKTSQGALVTEVIDTSPAAKAGIRAGDVILSFNSIPIRSTDQLPWLVSTAGGGNDVDIEFIRAQKQQTVRVRMEDQPNQKKPNLSNFQKPGSDLPSNAKIPAALPALGVQVKALTDSLARQLGAQSTGGVVVTSLEDSSPAVRSGLRRRDVITEIGEHSIGTEDDFQNRTNTLNAGEVVRLKIVRGGRIIYLAFER